jgi:hypothetical protein
VLEGAAFQARPVFRRILKADNWSARSGEQLVVDDAVFARSGLSWDHMDPKLPKFDAMPGPA